MSESTISAPRSAAAEDKTAAPDTTAGRPDARWRDLMGQAADLAFETDAAGRLVFVWPERPLGWRGAELLGQPASLLLAEPADNIGFDPFLPREALRRRRLWLAQPTGTPVCVALSVVPMLDRRGALIGARGIGIDMTAQEARQAHVTAALHRGALLEHILWCIRREIAPARMMRTALDALANALGAEGAAVIGGGSADAVALLHTLGDGAVSMLPTAAALLQEDAETAVEGRDADGRRLLVASCRTRLGARMGLVLWRAADARGWEAEDQLLVAATSTVVRVVLEHETIQQEMNRQSRVDPLTGLLNRRGFIEELRRHIPRLDRDGQTGTLVLAAIDRFRQVNERLGYAAGDAVLSGAAKLLRATVRPSDLIARLDGDVFATWLNGADHMTAAERAEQLRAGAPRVLAQATGDDGPMLTLSIGIAPRAPGSSESIEELMNRADGAMHAVKRDGRGHWRVARLDDD